MRYFSLYLLIYGFQYERAICEFKKAHKTLRELKKTEDISTLTNDSKNIDRDIECLSRKLDHMKAKVKTNWHF